MENVLIEEIYDTLCGAVAPGLEKPGVENAFAIGESCELLYRKVYDAERRLEQRLGVEQEDEDVQTIIDALLDIQRELCFRMYCYGAKFGMGEE